MIAIVVFARLPALAEQLTVLFTPIPEDKTPRFMIGQFSRGAGHMLQDAEIGNLPKLFEVCFLVDYYPKYLSS